MHSDTQGTRKEPSETSNKSALCIYCHHACVLPPSIACQVYQKCDVLAASVTRFTISQAVPHLVKLFMSPDEALTRPATMLLLSDLIIAARDPSGQDLGSEHSPALTPYKDDVFTITMVALGNISSRQPALASLDGLVTTKGLLSDDELGTIVNNINDLLQAERDENGDTR